MVVSFVIGDITQIDGGKEIIPILLYLEYFYGDEHGRRGIPEVLAARQQILESPPKGIAVLI